MHDEAVSRAERRTKQDFRFRDTRLCFALPATLGNRGSDPLERLRQPDDLARWSVESGLVHRRPVVTGRDLGKAIELREAIQRVGEALVREAPPAETDISCINRFAAAVPLTPRLAVDGQSADWIGDRIDAVLSLIARDAVTLYGGPLRDRVRLCANPACRGLFVDESRPGTRRWCSMSTCGNAVKKATYRNRRRDATPTTGLPPASGAPGPPTGGESTRTPGSRRRW